MVSEAAASDYRRPLISRLPPGSLPVLKETTYNIEVRLSDVLGYMQEVGNLMI